MASGVITGEISIYELFFFPERYRSIMYRICNFPFEIFYRCIFYRKVVREKSQFANFFLERYITVIHRVL